MYVKINVKKVIARGMLVITFCSTLIACNGDVGDLTLETYCQGDELTLTDRLICNEADSQALVSLPAAQEVEHENDSAMEVRLTFSSEKGLTSCGGIAEGPAGEIYSGWYDFAQETVIYVSVQMRNPPLTMHEYFVYVSDYNRPDMIGTITLDEEKCQGFTFELPLARGAVTYSVGTLDIRVVSFDGKLVGQGSLKISGDLLPDLYRQGEGVDVYSREGITGPEFTPGELVISADISPDGKPQCVIVEAFNYDDYANSWVHVTRVDLHEGGASLDAQESGNYRISLVEKSCDQVSHFHSSDIAVGFLIK